MFVYTGSNRRPFSAVCHHDYGRKMIVTNETEITERNIVEELNRALVIHRYNADAIEYLDRYYRGDQPILYREKKVRPDVNNRIAVNLAYELVERKVADAGAEPMQYVLRGTDARKAEEISWLNAMMDAECKQACDIDILRWRSICGTAYRYIEVDAMRDGALDECMFRLTAEDPRLTFVVYYGNNKPAFSCQIRRGLNGDKIYYCYTENCMYCIVADGIRSVALNTYGMIPVIEYPNNTRRLSDIEITIPITDAINTLTSDRINAVEQFVAAWIKFVNCEVDAEQFHKMREEGALVVKSNNGSEGKADVEILTSELNQTEGQVVFNDLFERFLSIQGLANRQGNTGGDTQGAVNLRNGHYDAGLRTAINEPIIKKSERAALKYMIHGLHAVQGFTLMPSDVNIHINHNKMDNIMVKAEVLQILLQSGIDPKEAIKTSDMFSDSERVMLASEKRMRYLYPDEAPAQTTENTATGNDGAE